MWAKIKKQWDNLPLTTRELLKEVWRWSVATFYSVAIQAVQEFVISGKEFELDSVKLLLVTIIIRFMDRVAYLIGQNTTNEKTKSLAETATKIYSLSK